VGRSQRLGGENEVVDDPRAFGLRVDAHERGGSRDCAAHGRYRESTQEGPHNLRASSPERTIRSTLTTCC